MNKSHNLYKLKEIKKNGMKKRGISPLIGTVLLIGFVILLTVIVFKWGGNYYQRTTDETSQDAEVAIIMSGLDLELKEVSGTNLTEGCDNLTLLIENNIDTVIESFKIRVTTANETILGEVNATLPAFNSKWLNVDIECEGEIEKIEIYPRLEINDQTVISSDPADTYNSGSSNGGGGSTPSPTCTDDDDDGYGNPGSTACTYSSQDCNDTNNQTWESLTGYQDSDLDFHESEIGKTFCTNGTLPSGYVGTQGDDCNDTNQNINPGETETCDNNIDDNCNNLIDCLDAECSSYPACNCIDNDGDNYGNPASEACTYSNLDCNDSNINVNPGETEICNGIDDNCDTQIDEGVCPTINYYCDSDIDTFISLTLSGSCNTYSCLPIGCTETQGDDCDDTNNTIYPDAIEVCNNNVDDNCNALTDCEESNCAGNLGPSGETCCQIASDCSVLGDLECLSCTSYACNLLSGEQTGCNLCSTCDLGSCIFDNDPTDCSNSFTCPLDGCGLTPCSANIFTDYPNLIPEVCTDIETCGTSTTCEAQATCTGDSDGDNYATQCGDCNDSEFNINPGITEDCGNFIDDDCDGETDLADSDCIQGYTDYKECENAETILSPFFFDDNNVPTFFGTGYLDTPVTTPIQGGAASSSKVAINVDIPQDGEYYLWIRMYAIDGSHDSFWVGFNSNFDSVWMNGNHGIDYIWEKVETVPGTLDYSHDLLEGINTVDIDYRENQTRCDRILVTDDPEFIPSGTPEYPLCTDSDTDTYLGYDITDCPIGDDCNDTNENINPGEIDLCSNGIDEDCSTLDLICQTCAQGAVPNYGCTCGGTDYYSGYCCSDSWQPGICDDTCPYRPFEGFGATTQGAKDCPTGYTNYTVNSLGDSGVGTLRDALSQGCRYINFSISGTIEIDSQITVTNNYITINGSDATNPGIDIKPSGPGFPGALLSFTTAGAHDIIINNLRLREAPDPSEGDNLRISTNAYNIVIDHCSFTQGEDGNLDIGFGGGVHDITVQWCLMGDNLKNQLIRYQPKNITLHHNLYVSDYTRSPLLDIDSSSTFDFINNVVFDWESSGSEISEFSNGNLIKNYYLPGITTTASKYKRAILIGNGTVPPNNEFYGLLYFEDNVIPSENDPYFVGITTPTEYPVPYDLTTETSAEQALVDVYNEAGACPRDTTDSNYVSPILNELSVCADGVQISNNVCICNGAPYASGYCCSGSWQAEDCGGGPICGDTNETDWYVLGEPDCNQCDHAGSDDTDACDDTNDVDCGGTETICDDGLDNDCDGLQNCNDPDCSLDPACNCQIIDYHWSLTPSGPDAGDITRDAGTTIYLVIEGDTNCDGQQVNLEYFDKDLGPDDNLETEVGLNLATLGLPSSLTFSGTTISYQWNSMWFNDTGDVIPEPDENPDYVFQVDGSSSSNTLEVAYNPATTDCTNIYGAQCCENGCDPGEIYSDLDDTCSGWSCCEVCNTTQGSEEADYYVDKDGIYGGACSEFNDGTSWDSPWCSIEYGINNMGGGDILLVADGDYTETDAASGYGIGRYTPAGLNANNPTVLRAEGSNVNIYINDQHGFYLYNGAKNYVTIEGFNIYNSAGTCLYVQQSNVIGVKLLNNSCMLSGGIKFATAASARASRDHLIEGNYLSGETIDIGAGGYNISILNNIIENDASGGTLGILIGGTGTLPVEITEDVIFSGNIILDPEFAAGHAGSIKSAKNIIFSNNLWYGVWDAVILWADPFIEDVLFDHNTIVSSRGSSYHLLDHPTYPRENVTITNCVIADFAINRYIDSSALPLEEFFEDYNYYYLPKDAMVQTVGYGCNACYTIEEWRTCTQNNGRILGVHSEDELNPGLDIYDLFVDPSAPNWDFTPKPGTWPCGNASDGSDVGAFPCA